MPIIVTPVCRAEMELVDWLEAKGVTLEIVEREDENGKPWMARVEHSNAPAAFGDDPLEAAKAFAASVSGQRIKVGDASLVVPVLRCTSLAFRAKPCQSCGKVHGIEESGMGCKPKR